MNELFFLDYTRGKARRFAPRARREARFDSPLFKKAR